MRYNITFREDTHQYFVNGFEYPSVSFIFKKLGLADFSKINAKLLERAVSFGSAVHMMLDYEDNGLLDESDLDENLKPWLLAWRAYKKKHKVELISIEQPTGSLKYKYCGTPDRVVRQKTKSGTEIAILDFKTGKVVRYLNKLQMIFYEKALKEQRNWDIANSYLLKFNEKTGNIVRTKVGDLDNPREELMEDFKACVRVFNLG